MSYVLWRVKGVCGDEHIDCFFITVVCVKESVVTNTFQQETSTAICH